MNKQVLWSFCLALTIATTATASVRIEQLQCEHVGNPIGIGIRQPRLSWKLRLRPHW